MPFMVELARSNRSTCRCSGTINKNELRIGNKKGFYVYWYHVKCFKKYFNITEVWLHRFRGHSMLKGNNRKKFDDMILYFNSKRAKIRLTKHIDDMKTKELKEELSKRGLTKTGNKNQLQNRLRDFMETNLCIEYQKADNEKLVIAYSRKKQKKYKLNVPQYLDKLIISYFPLNVL
eukprot:154303_1